ncbi:permease prefix domain 1-containing protein [Deinococcus aerius]|uniref:permease prefix domain 1-containing protein n=1 Tax=Deinococcus aerius TaxID=200253 RepID=UPI0010571E72|nr:permease prefix domain 1-containing protein [Deinococcus aerius]
MRDEDERRYLRRATQGLWGRKRREVQAELRGHLDARRRELALIGLSPEAATRQALHELGEPERVSVGLARVYLLPTVARTTMLSALLGCGAFLAATDLSRGLAQVRGYQPRYAAPGGPFTYLDIGSLQAELRGAGVGVAGTPTRPVLTFPNAPGPVVVETGGGNLGPYLSRSLVRDYGSGQVYLDANTLAQSLLDAGLDVRVRGWVNPQLQVGDVTLRLGTPAQPVEAYNLYSLALTGLARELGLRAPYSARWSGVDLASHHTLRVPGGAEDVYALVTVQYVPPRDLDPRANPLVLAFDLARPGASGRLAFALPYDTFHLRLTGNVEDLRQDARRLADPAQRLRYASAQLPAHALLLRLSGELAPRATPYTLIPRSESSVGN